MMKNYVERTCTEVADNTGAGNQTASRPLSDYRDCSAYVLLGAPGAGKTEAFHHEARSQHTRNITARNFIALDIGPERRHGVLFVDGLDELRAGHVDGRTQLDWIRTRLDKLGRPRFRLACREADWLGANDREHLKAVSPDGTIVVLRLDPLSHDNIRYLLKEKWGVDDPDEFVAKAGENGISDLLPNPQNLKMLASAVAGGTWPEARRQTFELACQKLVHEPNSEHGLANRNRASTSNLLAAAGQLCAVQLLAGTAGYSLTGGAEDTEYPQPNCMANGDPKILRDVLQTRVFESNDDGIVPVHRHVAEFLAGRYLSNLVIERSLPTRRLLALMTGEDGRTVSALRGLGAWLGVHCREARDELLERDPLGTVLYGDVREFSVDEKGRLLACLEADAERDPRVFAAMHDLDTRWSDLATENMGGTFQKILTVKERSQGQQTVALAVLESLKRGAAIPQLTPMLLDIVRDDGSWLSVREVAFEAYVRQSHDRQGSDHELKGLLEDVYGGGGSESDPHDNLLGLLLKELYPRVLPPAEVARYLREQERPLVGGWYWRFWEEELPGRSNDAEFAEFLDALFGIYRNRGWTGKGDSTVSYWLRTMPARLLSRYLEGSPAVDDERLFVWLGFAMTDAAHGAEAKIRTWLSGHPDSYKAVVRLAADHDKNADSPPLQQEIYDRLSISVKPPDFGAWCLAQAAKTTGNTEAATEFFLEHLIDRQDDERISDKAVDKRLAHDPSLLAKYKQLRQRRDHNRIAFKSATASWDERQRTETDRKREHWRVLVETHISELRENRAAPGLLQQLASAYSGSFADVQGDDGPSRLRDLLGDDGLVDTVLQAFRASTTRADLPDADDIFVLADKRQYHLLMLSFLVGLEQYPTLEFGAKPLDEKGTCRALAFRFNAPDLWNQEPDWYRNALTLRPDLVADVLVRAVKAALRRGSKSSLGLYELRHVESYRAVAGLAVAPLLKSFPVRAKVEQLNALSLLVHAALRHSPEHDLIQIVEKKLRLGSMDAAQRVYWLCAGVLAAPESFSERLRRAFTGRSHERRIRHAAELLSQAEPRLIERFDVPTLEFLITALGDTYRPYGWSEADDESANSKGPEYSSTSLVVNALITTISSKPARDATGAIERLSAEATLGPWHLKLRDAAGRQREVRRETNFHHPTVEQVLATLDNQRPANAADLAALTADVLADLAREIRHGDTSGWRQYWNVDPYNRPAEPRPENACRDALLSALKTKLGHHGIDARQEVIHADDKKADIVVSIGSINVPMEAKRSNSGKLWTALRNQLIARYTRDPGSDGYGIYLIFWFGPNLCKRLPNGPAPETPDALREQLLAVANLSPEERRKISIRVIDVSKPDSVAKAAG